MDAELTRWEHCGSRLSKLVSAQSFQMESCVAKLELTYDAESNKKDAEV